MAGKTDIVTGRVGQLAGEQGAQDVATNTQNEDLENFQLRPIVLLWRHREVQIDVDL